MYTLNFNRRKSVKSVEYAAPQIRTLEMVPEGVICFSAQQTEQYNYMEFSWE